MAELVQEAFESSIKDLAPLVANGLFEQSEIKQILKRRNEFEYRLRKTDKTIEDFLVYISYEYSVLKLIESRLTIGNIRHDPHKVKQVCFDHMKRIFDFSVKRFPFELSVWLTYLKFAQSNHLWDLASNIYFRILQVHNLDYLWIDYAKFELEKRSSSESARKVFLKATKFHPESKNVWHEYFRFELIYCSKMLKRRNFFAANPDKSVDNLDKEEVSVLGGKLALIVYKYAVKTIKDFEFASKFISISCECDFEMTKEIKKSILNDISTRFGENEQYWDLLAKTKITEIGQKFKSTRYNKNQKLTIKQEDYKEAVAIYEEACSKLNTCQMWLLYLMFRYNELRDTSNSLKASCKVSEILVTLEKLWKEDKVSPEVFEEWTTIWSYALGNDLLSMQKLQDVVLEASQRWPDNIKMHKFISSFLSYNLRQNNNDRIVEKFYESALKKFTSFDETNEQFGIGLWEGYIGWARRKVSYSRYMSIVNRLSNQWLHYPRSMAEHLKRQTLMWICSGFGIEKAREFYHQNKFVSPIFKAFFDKMADEEALIDERDYSDIYEDMLRQFGTKDAGIWISYIHHKLELKKFPMATHLYQRATHTLNSTACKEFVEKYSKININYYKEFEYD